MKKGWQTKTLGDVCDFIGGSQPPKAVFSKVQTPDSIRLIQIRDYKSDNHVVYIPKAQARRFCTADDIMIGRYGPPIFQILRGLEGAYNVALMKAVPDETQVCREFLFYFLKQPALLGYVIYHSERAAGQIGVTKETLAPYPIAVPPLTEQERIVGLLDEAFEGLATAKANAEKNLQNARALFESHLQSVFTQRGPGWVETLFEDCIEDVKYTAKIQRKEFLDEGAFPIVSQEAEFTNGYWDNATDVFKVTTPIVIFGDHTQVLKYIDFDFVLGADGVKILAPKPFLNPKFFFYALRSAPLKSLGYARHYRLLKELLIGYPDANTQVAIVAKLDAILAETQRLARIYERKLSALEALKKSLLHQAFTGEL